MLFAVSICSIRWMKKSEGFSLSSGVYMPNNPNGPYDDVFNSLAKIVEDIVRSMPDHQNARIVGYTIITRQPGSEGQEVFAEATPYDEETPYEVTESDDTIFVTADIPRVQRIPPTQASRQRRCLSPSMTGSPRSNSRCLSM